MLKLMFQVQVSILLVIVAFILLLLWQYFSSFQCSVFALIGLNVKFTIGSI